MVYVIQVYRQLSSSSRIRMKLQFHPDPAAILQYDFETSKKSYIYLIFF
jgi:hypothetical protein